MKYIRTKDGIYSYEPTHNIDVDGFVIQHNLTGWDKPLMKEDIVKITDTIEELCDKFVMLDTNFGNIVVPDIEAVNFNLSERGYVHYCGGIYGAIFTDKGLIYVAKMNDKGEMELL